MDLRWRAGGLTRGLTFRLGFTIAVLRDADAERSTEDVVWTLFEDLMSAIKTDPTLTGTIMAAGMVTGRQLNDPMPNMWRSLFTGSIECQSKFY
jgi:hypothetical protein